ncbi:MAG: branched-chain amino acid transporter AzlD [Micrococcales bacterium]|nr:MAG: branched-chain amino acid transporter AzlD [Micrococcales bacterium]PIE26642.1 MAG: branched-chain amino acid transporter AzlD [Micrococcales bacterium]
MTGWLWVLVACLACYLLKLVGYLAPQRWLSNPRVAAVSGLVTTGLLAALVLVQTVADGTRVVLDARLAAVGAAGVALLTRAPFLVVVLVGALAAAGVRAVGWG